MTKGPVLFGLAVGGTIGLFVPKIFGQDGFGVFNIITAIIGAVLGLIGIAIAVHQYGKLQ